MKIIHTSDWHIGKIVNEFSMIEDQRYMLKQLMDLIERERPQVLVIAGDIYDRSIPPIEAIELLDEALSELTIKYQVKVMLIAGNHDGAERLGFANRLLEKQGLYIAADDEMLYKKVVLEEDKNIHFYLVPYKEPALVRKLKEDSTIKTHEDVMRVTIDELKEEMDREATNILVAHGYVSAKSPEERQEDIEDYEAASLETSESERPLAIGGTDIIDAKLMEDFDYVALGHLHGPQKVGRESVRYSGSLLKYSFSEVKQKKGAVIIEASDDKIDIQFESIKPLRQMRVIKGELDEVVEKGRNEIEGREDYIHVILTDEGELMNPIDKLRAVYKNIMLLTREEHKAYEESQKAATSNYKEKSKLELFDEFYGNLGQYEYTEEKREVVKNVINEILGKGEVQ